MAVTKPKYSLDEFTADMNKLLEVSDLYEDMRIAFQALNWTCHDYPAGKLFDAFIEKLNLQFEYLNNRDAADFISWFIFVNDWGENEYEAGYSDQGRWPILTIADLYDLIMQGDPIEPR
jgi:hypothetical protein